MKNIKIDPLVELAIYQSRPENVSSRAMFDEIRGSMVYNTKRVGSENNWGFGYVERKFPTWKLNVMRDDFGADNYDWAVIFGLEQESSSSWNLYGVIEKRESSPKRLEFVKINIDPTDSSSHTIQESYEGIDISDNIDYGLIVERDQNNFKVYADNIGEEPNQFPLEFDIQFSNPSPESEHLEYRFRKIPWDIDIFGVWGYYVELNNIFGMARMGLNRANMIKDYEIHWDEGEVITGFIELKRVDAWDDVYIGHNAFIYLDEFRRDISASDLYGERTIAMGGYVEEIRERDNTTRFTLKGERGRLDQANKIVLADDIDENSVDPLDYFDALDRIYDTILNHKNTYGDVKSSGWHNTYDRVLPIQRTYLDAEKEHLYWANYLSREDYQFDGAYIHIDLYQPGSGVIKEIKPDYDADNEKQNVITEFNIEKIVGEGDYTNSILLKSKIGGTDKEFWAYRENRFDRFFNRELPLNIQKELDIDDYAGSVSDAVSIAEDWIDDQRYAYKGNIKLKGHHHYLGGMHRSGKVVITDSKRGIDEEEMRVTGININPGKTQLFVSQIPFQQKRDRLEKLRDEIEYQRRKDVFSDLSEQRLIHIENEYNIEYVFEPIMSVQLRDIFDEPITNMVFRENYNEWRGYKWVDVIIEDEDVIKNGTPPASMRLMRSDAQSVYIDLTSLYQKGIWLFDENSDHDTRLYITIGLKLNYNIDEIDWDSNIKI